ncbi:hypothetical protein [Streptomyces sp. NPDC002133]|uniref:hypothetical protein n=1 Tax=Streptomyces sp. NPDC002133 TaxID=3154409 RepID=UPI00332E80A1
MACKKESNLLGIWFATESTIQNAMIRVHHGDLEDLRKTHAASVRTAQAITVH